MLLLMGSAVTDDLLLEYDCNIPKLMACKVIRNRFFLNEISIRLVLYLCKNLEENKLTNKYRSTKIYLWHSGRKRQNSLTKAIVWLLENILVLTYQLVLLFISYVYITHSINEEISASSLASLDFRGWWGITVSSTLNYIDMMNRLYDSRALFCMLIK